MKLRVNSIRLSLVHTANLVTFSVKEMILRMVTNNNLFCRFNVLLYPESSCSCPHDSMYYGEVNSSTWMTSAISKECSQPNIVFILFWYFIDGLIVDKNSKLTFEAGFTYCLWFNKKACNRASTWWMQGFIHNQKLIRDHKNSIRNDSAQDYHDMIGYIIVE